MREKIANQNWNNFIWPDWVLPEIKEEIVDFWKESWGRGPAEWHENAVRSKAPKFGARVKVEDFSGHATDGRFIFAWNNIGRLVGDDGKIKYVGVHPFLISKGGLWTVPEPSDYAAADDHLPFYAAETPIHSCEHMRANVYSRLVSRATLEEPAEYDHKIVCKDCGEGLDIVPDGAEETEAKWEEDVLED